MQKDGFVNGRDDKGLISSEEEKNVKFVGLVKDEKVDSLEEKKKAEESSKRSKKVPNEDAEARDGEPYIVTRGSDLPLTWDGPNGTVVCVNKPKGDLRLTLP